MPIDIAERRVAYVRLSRGDAAAVRTWLAHPRAGCRAMAITATHVSLVTDVGGEELAACVPRSADLYVDLVRAHRRLLGSTWWDPSLT